VNAGVTLLGRALGWDGRRLQLAPDLGANVRFADEVSGMFGAIWDRRAPMSGQTAEALPDPADEADEALYALGGPASLDLEAHGIATIIWATGFGPSIGWLPPGALDHRGHPQVPNLHVIGAPWITHRSSGNLYGMAADAERLADSFADTRVCAAA
jgi:putative flavoprotein involved in K+ transport